MENKRWTAQQVILATLSVVLVAIAVYLLYRFLNVLLILFVAFVISVVVRPIALRLRRRGVPVFWADLGVHIAFIVIILAIVLLVAPIIVDQVVEGVSALPEQYARVRSALIASPSTIVRRLALTLPRTLGVDPGQEVEETIDRVARLLQYLAIFIQIILISLSLLIVSIYWTIEVERLVRSVAILLPARYRDGFREIATETSHRIGDFVQGQVITMAAVGTLAFIAYVLIGLPYALLLGFIAALMEAIPFVGPALGAIPAGFVALSIGWPSVIWVIVATLIIQFIESNVLAPRVMSKAVGIRPLVIILSLAIFGTLLGTLGALLAIPMAAILQLLFEALVAKHEPQPGATVPGRDELSALRYRAQELAYDARHQLVEEDREDDAADSKDTIESIATELDGVLAQAMMENRAP
jgi:predicted PurR-regulated permease PerM